MAAGASAMGRGMGPNAAHMNFSRLSGPPPRIYHRYHRAALQLQGATDFKKAYIKINTHKNIITWTREFRD